MAKRIQHLGDLDDLYVDLVCSMPGRFRVKARDQCGNDFFWCPNSRRWLRKARFHATAAQATAGLNIALAQNEASTEERRA